MKTHLSLKVGFEGMPKLDLCWEVTTCYLQVNCGVKVRIWVFRQGSFSLVGHNFSWLEWVGHGLKTRSTTTASRKPQRCSSKMCVKIECIYFCEPLKKKRLKQTQKTFLPAYLQKLFLLEKELGPRLNHKIIPPLIIQCRSNWSLFFVILIYLEKWCCDLNLEMKDYLRNHFVQFQQSSDGKWKSKMARGGGNKKRFQYCTDSSEQAILYLRTQFHWSFITRQCLNSGRYLRLHFSLRICNPFAFHQFQDWEREDKIWAKDRQHSFCFWISWFKEHKKTWYVDLKTQLLHDNCRQRGRNIQNARCLETMMDDWILENQK